MTYGSSPVLTGDWDFQLDTTGDLRTTDQVPRETAELEKDLSFQLASQLDDELGSVTVERVRFKSLVRTILSEDPRVASVSEVNIKIPETNDNEYRITVSIVASDDNISTTLIIEV